MREFKAERIYNFGCANLELSENYYCVNSNTSKVVRYNERVYIVSMVKGLEKIVCYIESSLNRGFVKQREFINKLFVRIQGT